MSDNMEIYSIKKNKAGFEILDQTQLPEKEVYLQIDNYLDMIDVIKRLAIRGAPAIGVAAAAGAYLAAKAFTGKEDEFYDYMLKVLSEIEASRPTAVNLFYATQKIREILHENNYYSDIVHLVDNLMSYEYEACEKMAENGLKIIPYSFTRFLTHCNTGSLATYGRGTALGVLKKIAEQREIEVYVDETRPLLQGARLTMWELKKANINCTLITDNMAARVIETKGIQAIIVGADRIAKNGDVANKIGTYNLAILAKYFKIPFYVVAPQTTFDKNLKSGEDMIIEERAATEITHIKGIPIAPDKSNAYNPAFDITPHELITKIITNH